jgi:hypothetical protein
VLTALAILRGVMWWVEGIGGHLLPIAIGTIAIVYLMPAPNFVVRSEFGHLEFDRFLQVGPLLAIGAAKVLKLLEPDRAAMAGWGVRAEFRAHGGQLAAGVFNVEVHGSLRERLGNRSVQIWHESACWLPHRSASCCVLISISHLIY